MAGLFGPFHAEEHVHGLPKGGVVLRMLLFHYGGYTLLVVCSVLSGEDTCGICGALLWRV
ncbi:MAG: hypothetical protein CFH37_00164 [Alphaproteobacteria bacterium MarineAlpha9_Bin7]|nr:MAG: hypothetical protein CFH37_00164 [Alphaproteobacteria bacterium MarineAlpha9_Bin7]